METNSCALKLNHLVFDNFSFTRHGFKNESAIKYNFGFAFDSNEVNNVIVHIRVIAKKEKEFDLLLEASGFFSCVGGEEQIALMTKQNAVAIIFPFIRSQLSLLTAQPEMEPIVLPPLNIAKMVEESETCGKISG